MRWRSRCGRSVSCAARFAGAVRTITSAADNWFRHRPICGPLRLRRARKTSPSFHQGQTQNLTLPALFFTSAPNERSGVWSPHILRAAGGHASAAASAPGGIWNTRESPGSCGAGCVNPGTALPQIVPAPTNPMGLHLRDSTRGLSGLVGRAKFNVRQHECRRGRQHSH